MKCHRLLRLLWSITTLSLLLTGIVQAGEHQYHGFSAWPAGPLVTHTPRTIIPAQPGIWQALVPAWHIETVDSAGDVGWWSSLVLDTAGRPHIGYIDWTNKALKYVYYDGSSWVVETVSGAGYVVRGISLALDDQDRPHISYCTGEDGWSICSELRYAWHDGTTWITTTVDSRLDVGYHSSLALDAAAQPHIAYNGVSGLTYAYFDGTTWITTTVGYGGAPSLVLDAADWPHIAYASADLRYTYYNGTNWVSEDVWELGETTCCTSLVLDSTGQPHIAWCAGYHPATSVLWYAARDGAGWHVERLDWGDGPFAGGPGGSSLALDATGNPHISYDDLGKLRYAHHDGAAWWIERIGTETGGSTSLVLDATDRAHFSYATGDLKYASQLCTPVLGVAVRGPIRLPIGATGRYTATAGPLDANPPITLTWADGTMSPTVAYSWTVAGPVPLAVTATNACGQVRGALTVTVCLPLKEVVLSGPPVLYPGQAGTFYATPQPISTTPPLTYTWDNGTVGPTSTYSWPATGTYALVVAATNNCGSAATASRPVQVVAWPYSYYLPLAWQDQRGSD